MAKLSKFGEDFLLLALRIDKHIKGYVDFYFGPKKLQDVVSNEAVTSPNKLLDDCNTLQKNMFLQGCDKESKRYLEKNLIAMRTSIETLNAVEIPFREKFLRLYDVDLQPINETEFANLLEDLNEAYKGIGNLDERMKVLREKRKVPEDKVYPFFKKALTITKMKTEELFKDLLPIKEKILIELVKDDISNKLK